MLIALALIPCACGADTYDLKRIGTPIRFRELRETAAWVPNFQPSWWNDVEAVWDVYEQEIARIARDEWDPFVRTLQDFEQTGFPTDRQDASALWQTHRRLQRVLGDAEAALVLALDERLPSDADAFIELVRQRMMFWRAASQWTPHAARPAGPLEVLALDGGARPDAAVVAAATQAYARLQPAAIRAAEARYAAYLNYCEDLVTFQNEIDAATAARDQATGKKATDAANARLDRAVKRREQREKRLRDRDRRAADEELRVALLREGRLFAESLSDAPLPLTHEAFPDEPAPSRRSDFCERLDAFLHSGVRSAPSLRAMRAVALRLLEETASDDTGTDNTGTDNTGTDTGQENSARAAAVRDAFANYFRRQAPLRERLASPDVDARRKAYEELVALVEPLYGVLREQLGAERIAGIEGASQAVAAGTSSTRDAVLRILEPKPVKAVKAPIDDDDQEGIARRENERMFLGAPLAPRVMTTLASRLALDEGASLELMAIREMEAKRIAELTRPLLDAVGQRLRIIGEDMSIGGPDARARAAMREVRSTLERTRSIDRAANERVLAEAARLGGVGADDARIATARLELDLLSIIGSQRRSREAQGVVGTPPEAIVNPFEIVRLMDIDEATRDAAESLVLDRAMELRAAHAELEVLVARNMENFFHRMFLAGNGSRRLTEAWYPELAGKSAMALRFAIGDEIRNVLGEDAGDAYFERLRAWCQPGMEPPRPDAIRLLDRFAAGVALDNEKRAATEAMRVIVAEFVESTDEARARELRALHVLRAASIRGNDLEGAGAWDEVAGVLPSVAVARARIADLDERVVARCEVLLETEEGCEMGLDATRHRAARLPQRLSPYFGGK
jgi:hypothetical protein